jgi:hypothetical protein
MAWTDPRTWADGEVPSASTMNAHIRDQFRAVRRLIAYTKLTGAGGATEIKSVTGATFADFDATSHAVTFTVPASGNVLVTLSAMSSAVNAVDTGWWNLREGSSDISGSAALVVSPTVPVRCTHDVVITGLSAGATKTYKWGGRSTAGLTVNLYMDDASGAAEYGPALMEVWQLP